MTAQAREKLIFKGEETWMAAQPLNDYLENVKDIKFVADCSACWRGYIGQWEIKDNHLYLIGLIATIEGNKEVGLDYLFPGQDRVFADWFSGEIRIPQGEMLDYVHMGYASLYERDLILVFKKGVLIKEYLVDNKKKYQRRIKERERLELMQFEDEAKQKKNDKIFNIVASILIVLLLIGSFIGVYYLIRLGTTLTYLFSTLIILPLILIIGGAVFLISNKGKDEDKDDKAIIFMALNLRVFVYICVCIGVFYLIKWGTIVAYLSSAILVSGVLYLVFTEIRKRVKIIGKLRRLGFLTK